MKDILIISYSDIKSDPRVMRQIRALEFLYNLSVIGYGSKPSAKINFFSLNIKNKWYLKIFRYLLLLTRLYHIFYWLRPEIKKTLTMLNHLHFNLILSNDIGSLPLALKLAKGSKVLFDAHEYSPKENAENFFWRITYGKFNSYICKKYLGSVNSMFTVSHGIAEEYLKNFGILPKVLYNAPEYKHFNASRTDFNDIKLIHHGAPIRSRHLEMMIKMVDYLDSRFSLTLMLTETNQEYLTELKVLARHNHRIYFIPAVSMENILDTLNQFDIGVYLLPPVNFNHDYALPNKFFEFVQARLLVAIGPSLEMKKILEQYGIGVISESFDPKDLAYKINQLNLIEIDKQKNSLEKAAFDLSAEKSRRILLKEINDMLGE
jgi:hypothetical protein